MGGKWKPRVDVNDPKNAMLVKLVDEMRREVRRRYGDKLTFEQRRDAAAEVMANALWMDTDKDLNELVTDEDEIEIDGRDIVASSKSRRQSTMAVGARMKSSNRCIGRWASTTDRQ